MKFLIKKEQAGIRLDKFVLTHETGYSRTYLQKQIKNGAVVVNGIIKKPSYILNESDKIETNILPPAQISLAPDPSIELNIVYEDNDVIVIDKPAGLTVHPSETQKDGTLVNGLLSHFPLLKDVGDPSLRQAQGKLGSGQANLRPGIVHRLDKDTSGLMIIAKNKKAYIFIKDQFKNKKVEKKYLALIVGRPKEKSGKIETKIARSKSDPTKQKVSQTGKKAVTLFKTVKEFKDFTLIEASPKTGRMHQIRVHLAWIGNPVAGDKKYGLNKRAMPEGLARQFLHSAKLTLILPNGQKETFISQLPPDLNMIVHDLK